MDKELYEALRRIVIHFSPEEGRHYAEWGKPKNHIFRDLLIVARHVDIRSVPTD
jgi:hypothetical protein